MIVASKLGPYYYGIWGFILMLIGYFSICNFGIANSVNVLMVQHKDDNRAVSDYVASALLCVGLLSFAVALVGVVVPLFHFDILEKYEIGILFYLICLYAIVDYFNKLFSNIYRVKNRLLELSFYQSSTALLTLCVIFMIDGRELLYGLFLAYFLAQLLSLLFFLFRGAIPFGGHASYNGVRLVFKKGFYLFLYNSCFYMILVSTSTIISYYYTVSEYGLYTFSYNLGNAVLLILEAFAFILFPKMLDKFYSGNNEVVLKTLEQIRVNYVVLTHGLMYVAFSLFPIFIMFFPQYHDALMALWFTALSVMLTVNSFGYNTLLISRNRERLIAMISIVSLLVNVAVGLIFAHFHAPYYMIVVSVMISYILFAVLCGYYACRQLELNINVLSLMKDLFPMSLLIPFVLALLIATQNLSLLSFMPLVVFLAMNKSNLCNIFKTINNIRKNPLVADINN
jgi:O-antigen/teichoic acid export membrane protein